MLRFHVEVQVKTGIMTALFGIGPLISSVRGGTVVLLLTVFALASGLLSTKNLLDVPCLSSRRRCGATSCSQIKTTPERVWR